MPDAAPLPPTPTQRALKWTVFLGATVFVVYLCLQILRPFLNVIAWASVLAITFHPLHRDLRTRLGRPALSALISSAMVVVTFVIPLLFVVGVAIDQLLAIGNSLQRTFADPDAFLATPLGRAYEWATRQLGLNADAVVDWGIQNASAVAGAMAGYTVQIAASVTGAVISVVFIIFAMFLLFRDGDRIVATIPELLPFERPQSEALLLRIRDAIHGGVFGVVVIALIQGALVGGMFWLLGIPSAALWGMVTVLTSVLPMVGAAGVWVPGVVYLILQGRWPAAAVLAAWGVAVSAVDNFLRPKLVGGRVGLSELVMFFALLGGLRLFGILGIVLGPVLFAIAASIVDVLSTKPVVAEALLSVMKVPDDHHQGHEGHKGKNP
jgi:predicted PurR-regulated permease PerM